MSPFDPFALVAMLQAFYPIVSAANLARARAERPEYFGGGRLLGKGGDKMQLPDGRVWDLIFNVDGPISQRAWIAIDVTDDGGGDAAPFALEPGPLSFVDEEMALWETVGTDFAGLVGGHLDGFGGSDGILARAADDVIELDGERRMQVAYASTVEGAAEYHGGLRAALDSDNPVEVLESAEGQGPAIDANSGQYDEESPDDIAEPDPGDPPDDIPGGPEPPPQA